MGSGTASTTAERGEYGACHYTLAGGVRVPRNLLPPLSPLSSLSWLSRLPSYFPPSSHYLSLSLSLSPGRFLSLSLYLRPASSSLSLSVPLQWLSMLHGVDPLQKHEALSAPLSSSFHARFLVLPAAVVVIPFLVANVPVPRLIYPRYVSCSRYTTSMRRRGATVLPLQFLFGEQ